MVSQITNLTIVYSTVYWGVNQRKHQSSASLAFVRGIHRWPVNSPYKWPVTRKMFAFNDVIMYYKPTDDDQAHDLHTSTPCLTRSVYVLVMTSQSMAQCITGPRNCYAGTWKVMSYSLDIDFIYGDIQGRSCRKCTNLTHTVPPWYTAGFIYVNTADNVRMLEACVW